MKMTFEQFIDNPLGKNSAVLTIAARQSILDSYSKKWDVIMLRENGNINHFFYYDKKHNAYYAHFKIPSETVKNFYYDTVIKFTADARVGDGGKDLFKYAVQFYSNDPSFVYTYAYVFKKNDMFINELTDRMPREALRKAPNIKNPHQNTGYVKTIVFAYLLMKNKKYNDRTTFVGSASSYTYGHLSGNIESADIKIKNRQEKHPEDEVEGRKRNEIPEKAKEREKATKGIGILGNTHIIKPKTSTISKTKTSPGIGHFKSTKGIGHFNPKNKK